MGLVKDLDHTVFTVADIGETVDFYTNVLGFDKHEFISPSDNEQIVRVALLYGNKKINLHQQGKEMTPYAKNPKVGSQDVCFVLDDGITLDQAIEFVKSKGITDILGPAPKIGARGPMNSFYIRDPDGNLLEFAKY